MASKKIETFVQITASFVSIMFAYVILLLSTYPFYNWYTNLIKPFIAIDFYLIGTIWLILYFLLFITFYLVWQNGFENKQVKKTMSLLITLIILPIIFSISYFGYKSIILGLIIIIAVWILSIFTVKNALNISKIPGILLIPYIIWITYLIVLNGWILILNY